MTRQAGVGGVHELQQPAIVALEENPRAEQFQALANQRRGAFAERIGFQFGNHDAVFGFHSGSLLPRRHHGIADWQPKLTSCKAVTLRHAIEN